MDQPKRSNWPVYNPQEIETKWQRNWEQGGLHLASPRGEDDPDRPRFYCLDFFPYPSGDGLHVGHCRNYVPTDVLSRYKRMRGFDVLHPMGWDAFGEPAEQTAVRNGVHPTVTTARNTANFRRQYTIIGAGYDWTREINSSDPEYYRWTQWFFLLLYRRGLAYRDTSYQWWCEGCQTTLSSHEVAGGVCWRGHTNIYRRQIPAWYFRITAYADRLIESLETVDWPEPVKMMQRNWIGRSKGAEIVFRTDAGDPIPVFTTRPDTLFGVTFFVLAPEHSLVPAITTLEQQAVVEAYREQAVRQSEVERMVESRPKTGVFTGGYVINPINQERVPVWIADYVLPTYGTGAVMGVPAHDERDFIFARTNGLPIRIVVAGSNDTGKLISEPWEAYTGDGVLLNSGSFTGMDSQAGGEGIVDALEAIGTARRVTQYRMRDWLISRQRYWGTPIPIIHCPICGEQPVPESDLPVRLPAMSDFKPDGSGCSPLSRVPEFVQTTCPKCGGLAERETDTMGGFACSSWYFFRFTSPHYTEGPFDPESVRRWMPVDLYVGGAEHAVLHLLYSRFWTMVMHDAGLIDFSEPFAKLLNQGQLLGLDGQRMSKSRGNVITPDTVVDSHGADALRLYSMFMAPFDQDIAWSTDGLNGVRRFLNRVWELYGETYTASAEAEERDPDLERHIHQLIRAVEERIEAFRFNTMVSSLMEFFNLMGERRRKGNWHTVDYHQALKTLLLLMTPGAPHISEELWQLTGHSGSVLQQAWPVWDPILTQETMVEIPVQINGRLRCVISVPMDIGEDDIRHAALVEPRVQEYLKGKQPVRVIIVPGKLVNLVMG